MRVYRVAWFGALVTTVSVVRADGAPFSVAELRKQTSDLAERYFEQYQHPKTQILYGAKLSTKDVWTTPREIKAGK